MAAKLAQQYSPSSDKHRPLPRMGHISGCVNNKHIVQGGLTQGFSEEIKQQLNSIVEVFDTTSEEWTQEPARGDLPKSYLAASASSPDGCIYSFGGADGSQFYNTLYKLDPEMSWSLLSPQNADGAPMPKCDCGMVVLGDSIVIANGYGIPREPTASGFVKSSEFSDGRGWTNELHIYNLSKGLWSCPATSGEKPPPSSSFTFTAIDERRAVFFGGGSSEKGYMSDVYIFDISTLNWRKLNKPGSWPVERTLHAACCLNYGQMFPQLLITGGLDELDQSLTDIWILDVDRGEWRKVNDTQKGCWWHSLTATNLGPGLTEVMQFGGSGEQLANNTIQPKSTTLMLQFRIIQSSVDFQWELLSIADNKVIGSQERIVEKEQLLQWEREREGEREDEEGEKEDRKEVQKVQRRYEGQILAEKVVQIKKAEAKVIGLEGYGLKIHIRKKTPPKHTKYFFLRMAVLTTEKYQLPIDDGVLVSAIYLLDHSLGDRKLRRSITLQMQHCLSDVSQAQLGIVWSNDRVPPYTFKYIPGGKFEINGYSFVAVDHFSVFSAVYNLVKDFFSIQFMAMVYYTHIKPGSFKFHLFIIQRLDASIEEVRKSMERDHKFTKGATSTIEIGECVQLHLPEDSVSGWTMEHDNQKQMDYRTLTRQPAVPFEVSVKWSGELIGKKPEKLEYMLPIEDVEIKIESPDICSVGIPVLTRSMTLDRARRSSSVTERGRKSASVYGTIWPEITLDGARKSSAVAQRVRSASVNETGPEIRGIETIGRGSSEPARKIQTQDFGGFPPPTLHQLMEVVGVDLTEDWKAVGLGLGLENVTLKKIKVESNSLQDCMTEVFTEWKNQATSEYSWMKLAEVISSRSVNKPSLLKVMWSQLH